MAKNLNLGIVVELVGAGGASYQALYSASGNLDRIPDCGQGFTYGGVDLKFIRGTDVRENFNDSAREVHNCRGLNRFIRELESHASADGNRINDKPVGSGYTLGWRKVDLRESGFLEEWDSKDMFELNYLYKLSKTN